MSSEKPLTINNPQKLQIIAKLNKKTMCSTTTIQVRNTTPHYVAYKVGVEGLMTVLTDDKKYTYGIILPYSTSNVLVNLGAIEGVVDRALVGDMMQSKNYKGHLQSVITTFQCTINDIPALFNLESGNHVDEYEVKVTFGSTQEISEYSSCGCSCYCYPLVFVAVVMLIVFFLLLSSPVTSS